MKLKKTSDDTGLMIARILLGIVFFPHGAQKLFGWFGGFGFNGTMNFFVETMGLPWILALLVILIETLGALLLLAGFGTRITAFAFFALTLGIVFSSHIQNGFFMNWFGSQKGEGYEYFILVIAICLQLILNGAGKLSIDRYLTRKE